MIFAPGDLLTSLMDVCLWDVSSDPPMVARRSYKNEHVIVLKGAHRDDVYILCFTSSGCYEIQGKFLVALAEE